MFLISCVSQKKKGEYKGLRKFYHNTAAKYNAYFNARELLNLSMDKLEASYKEDYSKVLSVFPYEAIEDVNSEKASLDKAIEKVATDISIHKYSRWADDCYFLLAKAQYLKKDYETAEGSYEFLINEYQPQKLLEKSKSLKEKNSKAIKKEKEQKKIDAKKLAKQRAKEKAKAREKAKKLASKNKSSKDNKSAKDPIVIPYKEVESEPTIAKKESSPNKNLTNVGTKLFPHRPAYWEASIWASKNLIKRGKYYEADYKLSTIESDPSTAPSLKGELYATKANLFLQQEKYEDAVPALKQAIENTKKRKLKARYAYILGQLYQAIGRPVSSDEYFNMCISLHPSYDMSFHAKMNLLINKSLQGEGEDALISSLTKLSKDSKNLDYESEIFYAIGKIFYNKQKYTEAIEYLNKTVWSATAKNNIKSDAYYMLANIHFDQRLYQPAKYYFDSTLNFLGKTDKRRPVVNKMIANLKDIAEQIEIIELQDSLIRISKLSTKEKRSLALSIKNKNRVIVNPEDLPKNDNPDRKMLRGTEAIRSAIFSQDVRDSKGDVKSNSGGKSTFFAYDIKASNRGRSYFEQNWGNRVLEDNWRRSKKTSFASGFEEQEEKKDSSTQEALEEDLAEILSGIPSSDEELKAVHIKIQEALFQLGVAYRDKIEAYDRSKESLEKLLSRYPETQRQADALYYLYLDCLDLKDQVCADNNNNLLKTRFADSYYSKLINDPEYAKSLMNKKDELVLAYEKAYKLFEEQNYEEAHKILQALATKVKVVDPLMPKIAMMSAFCIGKTGGKEPYMSALKDIIATYPGTAQESKAKEIMRFLRGDNDAFEVINISEVESIDFKKEDDKMHFMMVVFFNPTPKQVDKAKISISDYHQKYHKLDNLKMTSVEINTEQNISAILIRKYDDKDQAMKYYKSAQKNRDEYIPSVQNFEIYPVTQNNYREILKIRAIKEYQAFFKKNYEGN